MYPAHCYQIGVFLTAGWLCLALFPWRLRLSLTMLSKYARGVPRPKKVDINM